MPHTIGGKSFHQATHYNALKENVEAGALFACNSKATQDDLLKIFPEVAARTTVIHNIVSDNYFKSDAPKSRVPSIITARLGDDLNLAVDEELGDYLLMVSTLEPRKNHQLLISAFERLKTSQVPNLKLILVGGKGWDFEPIEELIRPWAKRGELFHLMNVPAGELRVLYQHAAATICPSFGEGFDYSGIEAMQSGGLVISSDIPVHREVFGDGSTYFDPYSIDDAVEKIGGFLGTGAKKDRAAQRRVADDIADRYTLENIRPQWQEFLSKNRT